MRARYELRRRRRIGAQIAVGVGAVPVVLGALYEMWVQAAHRYGQQYRDGLTVTFVLGAIALGALMFRLTRRR